MYIGILSSSLDNTFKYKIRTKELPLRVMMPIRCETFIFVDEGRKSLQVEIDTDEDILFAKSNRMNLVVEMPCKVKFLLNNVTIRKVGKDYLLEFSSAGHN
jgi:hypothetical protein